MRYKQLWQCSKFVLEIDVVEWKAEQEIQHTLEQNLEKVFKVSSRLKGRRRLIYNFKLARTFDSMTEIFSKSIAPILRLPDMNKSSSPKK